MKALFAAVACFALSAPSPAPEPLAPHSTLWTDAMPPQRFQGPAIVTIHFVERPKIAELCKPSKPPPPNITILACTDRDWFGNPFIIMPLPGPSATTDYYAQLLTHEIAHASFGWPATHGD